MPHESTICSSVVLWKSAKLSPKLCVETTCQNSMETKNYFQISVHVSIEGKSLGELDTCMQLSQTSCFDGSKKEKHFSVSIEFK